MQKSQIWQLKSPTLWGYPLSKMLHENVIFSICHFRGPISRKLYLFRCLHHRAACIATVFLLGKYNLSPWKAIDHKLMTAEKNFQEICKKSPPWALRREFAYRRWFRVKTTIFGQFWRKIAILAIFGNFFSKKLNFYHI